MSKDVDVVIDEDGNVQENSQKEKEQKAADHKSEDKAPDQKAVKPKRWHRFVGWYKNHKKKSIPLTILVLLTVLAAIPWTRYQLAGLVLNQNFSLKVVDSVTNSPVSGASVSAGNVSALTDGSGRVTLRKIKVGWRTLSVTKKYYSSSKTQKLVPIFKQKTAPTVQLVATGRQVKISVKNLISHAALSNVDIKIADVSAKTDNTGSAIVVLPAATKSAKAALSLSGYNNSAVTVSVSDQTIQENGFNLTPTGKVYFLSKLSGTIDVVKTNLDGSGRQTVLAGTGKEDANNTVLLASRDWKFLALLSTRSGGPDPKLYLINTADDSSSVIDTEASVSINPLGWSDHNFVYSLTRENVQLWEPNGQAIKSYNADSQKDIILDQTQALGTTQDDYARENYNRIFVVDNSVVYSKNWVASYLSSSLSGKQAGIYSVGVSGGSPQTLKTFDLTSGQYTDIYSVPYLASQIYYQVIVAGGTPSYFAYSNGKVLSRPDIAGQFIQYQQSINNYLLSPSGSQTFWSEPRDGKNALLVGDQDGNNSKQAAILSDYAAYGWYTDNYLLVSKNSSELYIMPVAGVKADSKAVKISDYHKPSRDFGGYSGGYGGL